MKLIKILSAGSAIVAAMSLAGSVFAQTWNIEDVDVLVGTSTVTVPWQFTADGTVEALAVDIQFNDTLLTAVINESADCFDEVETQLPPGCTVVGNNIRVTTSNFPGTALVNQSGQLVFEIDAAAEVGDFSDFSMSVFSVIPAGTNVTLSPGRVEVVDAPPAELDVSPPSINFGNVRVDESSDESPIAICNDADAGSAPLSVTGITVSGDGFAEGAGGTCQDPTFSLDAGECCNFHVVFSPDAEAGFSGSVSVESSAGGATVDLSGQGTVTDASLAIDPTSFDFGTVDIEADAVCQDFAVSNTGSDDSLTVGTASVGGAPFSITGNTCDGATLVGGASCSVTVCFDPDADGDFTDALAVTSDVNDVSADLSGEGSSEAIIAVNPPFGPVNLGAANAGTTLSANGSVSNSGSASGEVSCELTPDADSAGVFSTEPSLVGPITVDPGASVAFQLFCALPDDADDGDVFTAELACDVDGTPAGTHDLSCSVQAFQPIPINTLQPLGLALFALLMLLIGGISIRLFRAS